MDGIQVRTISACPAVERAGLDGLNEGQKISYKIQDERGRQAAVNLKA
jgi:CspA family cold shock protein